MAYLRKLTVSTLDPPNHIQEPRFATCHRNQTEQNSTKGRLFVLRVFVVGTVATLLTREGMLPQARQVLPEHPGRFVLSFIIFLATRPKKQFGVLHSRIQQTGSDWPNTRREEI